MRGQQYLPLGQNRTVAFRAMAAVAGPQLAWIDKFGWRTVPSVRGYAWGRFTGDRQLVATAEYRDLVFPDLVSLWGIHPGLGYSVYVDAGRVWDSDQGLSFLADLRIGAGSSLLLTLNRTTVAQVGVAIGSEGPLVFGLLGPSF